MLQTIYLEFHAHASTVVPQPVSPPPETAWVPGLIPNTVLMGSGMRKEFLHVTLT